MLKIACVDDEREITDTLKKYTQRYGEEKNEAFSVSVFESGLTLLTEKMSLFDIVFLDVDMPNINGIETAKVIRKYNEKCLIIFVTNWAQYAINGYEVNAFDFIVKPVNYTTFSLKLQRAVKVAKRNSEDELVLSENYVKRTVFISDIYYLETLRHKVIYHTCGGIIETWDTMSRCRETLGSKGFVQCNSCFLVNLRHVEKIDGYTACVGGDELPISRNRRKEFLNALTSFRK